MATRFYAFYSLFLLLVLATYCDGLRDPRLPGSPLTETSGTTLNRLGRRDEEACADIGSHEDACGYVLSHCASLEAALPFLKFYYCSLPGVPWVAMLLLVRCQFQGVFRTFLHQEKRLRISSRSNIAPGGLNVGALCRLCHYGLAVLCSQH
jgi:hypothetical protein